MLKIYTRTGDKGQTSLYDNTRVSKDDIRVESYGTIDELNASLGLAKQYLKEPKLKLQIDHIQRLLFNVAGELAMIDGTGFPERIGEAEVEALEKDIDAFLDILGRDQTFRFVVPGSNIASAALHVARTVCRRAERRIITLSGEAAVSPVLMRFVNRLADYIYTLARVVEENPTYVEFRETEE